MNVTIVCNSFGFGGAEKMVFLLAEGLADRGHTVSMINLNVWTSRTREPSRRIKYKTAHIKKEGRIKTHYNYVKFVYDAARDFNTEILVSFTDMANFCVPIVAKLLHIPSVISERGDPESVYKRASWFMKQKFKIMNMADAAVFQTEGARAQYCNRLRSSSVVVPNPIFIDGDIPKIDYANRPNTVVTLSRLSNNTQKRFDVMLKAFAIFHQAHPDYRLIMYGDGDCRERIEKLSEDIGIRQSVILKGSTSNPLYDVSREGIFLTTSDYEGISNSLLEAMAIGMPIVSTDHRPGGARMLISDHHNGLLTPCRDIDAIAAALCEFAENPHLAESCGKAASQVLKRFPPERTINEWESFLIKVINNRN